MSKSLGVTVDHARFVALLAEHYPDVVADFDESDRGLIHLAMGALARAAQVAISNEDKAAVRDHFAFIGGVFRLATPEVRNAVCVSYLEHLGFDGRHGRRVGTRALLSMQLQEELQGLETYNARLFKGGKPA